jgi:hypothetical protein
MSKIPSNPSNCSVAKYPSLPGVEGSSLPCVRFTARGTPAERIAVENENHIRSNCSRKQEDQKLKIQLQQTQIYPPFCLRIPIE